MRQIETPKNLDIKRKTRISADFYVARQKGFEPLTYCLEGSCSILLSYWRKYLERVMGIEPT